MKLYSYVVRHDTGFAPNPFWGYCTLATCKPGIRQSAQAGDWVVGTGSVRTVGSGMLVYTIQVAEVLPLECYFSDSRFEAKKPIVGGTPRQCCGDNMYFKDDHGEWKWIPSAHHRKRAEKERDIKGWNVLIARHFYYFGGHAAEIPSEYSDLIVVRGYKYKHNPDAFRSFLGWLETSFKPGIHGSPYDNPGCASC